MRAVLKSPMGGRWQIDTPDARLVGNWLKSVVDSFDEPVDPHPIEFILEVTA